jgi:hypothetical protein
MSPRPEEHIKEHGKLFCLVIMVWKHSDLVASWRSR